MKRIFISHSSADAKIGEQLLDALVELGISKDEVFYSSNFHTGVGLGKNFAFEVKSNLQKAELIIFVLTNNFYRSPYCLNEMGAAWAFEKQFIPLLLDGLEYSDMKGFIDSHYIAVKPQKNEMYKVFSYLKGNFETVRTDINVEDIFKDFIKVANAYISKSEKEYIDPLADVSEIEKMILLNKLTDNEVLMLNYFIENQINTLYDVEEYDPGKNSSSESKDLIAIKDYVNIYNNFDYNTALKLLSQSEIIEYKYDYWDGQHEYAGSILNIAMFRDLISLSETAKQKIENIKNKNKTVNSKKEEREFQSIIKNNSEHLILNTETNEIETFIMSNKITEIDALLLKYMIDTSTYILGDRWKADAQILHIRMWEEENELKNILSRNYDSALRKLQFKDYIKVHSETSYGNPREWIIKEPYKTQLFNLSPNPTMILEDTIQKNKHIEEPLPF